jgi:hypothetical protein
MGGVGSARAIVLVVRGWGTSLNGDFAVDRWLYLADSVDSLKLELAQAEYLRLPGR